jgi:hypothetical protein
VKSPRSASGAVGFTVKSGWASVVLLTGSVAAPVVSDCRKIDLSDPRNPDARQPYHAGFGTARSSGRELSALVASVERFGRRSVADLFQGYRDAGHRLQGVGIVVGSLTDPERIANAHIRIHALEGRLFRKVVEDGAARSSLTCCVWRERDLYSSGANTFRQPEPAVRTRVAELREKVDGPWRAEQKAAALAAWLVLRSES